MKFLRTLLVLTLVYACGEDSNLDAVGNWTISEPSLLAPTSNATIVLNETSPATKVRFEWNAAQTSNRFIVQYTVALIRKGSEDYENPILKMTPGNTGKNLFVEATAEQIDYALWTACYPAGGEVELDWVVLAKSIEKLAIAKQAITFTRFETERLPETLFITGSGTEAGELITNATPMRAQKNGDSESTFVFDVYTTLNAGGTYHFRSQPTTTSKIYGGSEGKLEGCGLGITAPESGQYRVTVNFNDNTYSLLKIDRWSLVGDAIEGGWGGDVPLEYQGAGVWGATIEMYKPYGSAGAVFRANGDWGYLLKRIVGTASGDNNGGDIIMESEAGGAGVEIEDVPGPQAGTYKVTLDLSSDGYTYSFVSQDSGEPENAVIGETANPNGDAVSGNFDFGSYETPNELFLLSGGQMVASFIKDGSTFSTTVYIALEANKTYTLNSASNSSGQTYGEIANGNISVARDQAYLITVNFETGNLSWKYYNLKLFHWDDAGGGWDARQELLMTYSHPYTFKVTGTLSAGFDSKFNSPWDIQFGTDGTALTGTMTNGGANFKGIVQSGTYDATLIVSNDFASAEYTLVKQ